MKIGPLVEEDRILINDDLKTPDESLSHSQVNHEVEGFLLVGLSRKDQGCIVLLKMLVLKMGDHLA